MTVPDGFATRLMLLSIGSCLAWGCAMDGTADRNGTLTPLGDGPPGVVVPDGSAPPFGNDAGTPALPPAVGPEDEDGDGVPDSQDQCSHTALGAPVWPDGEWAGCAEGQYKNADDHDRDNVPDGVDQCPGTPVGTVVLLSGPQAGCPASSGPASDGGSLPPPPAADAGTVPETTPGFTLSAAEQDLVDALNQARQDNGLPPVGVDAKLTCAARMHATDYAGGCDHTGSDGSWPWDRAVQCGYPQDTFTVNEICAGPGFTSGPEAVWGWQQSSGHWAAIVHPQATMVGVGVGTNGCYVALFDCCVASM